LLWLLNSQSWIPACAGMTEMSELLTKQVVLGLRLRGDDGLQVQYLAQK
jgi:hypothetical protein